MIRNNCQSTSIIFPVILCGGSGTRLWPLSRKSYPKQFAPILGEESLFQATVKRLLGASFAAPVVVTNADFRFVVAEQLEAIGVKPAAILIEPEPRNTAPAVLAAALWINQHGMESLMLVAPSDHLMPRPSDFQECVMRAAVQADAGGIVTFGITPSRPETGYGYLELEAAADHAEVQSRPQALLRFVEKPNASRALEMISSGRHLWNSGIFLFSVASILKAYEQHASNLIAPVENAIRNAQKDLAFFRLFPARSQELGRRSFDLNRLRRHGKGGQSMGHAVWRRLVGPWRLGGGLDRECA